MPSPDDRNDRMDRLQRLLGGAGLSALRRRLRARFERGETRDEFSLTALNVSEQRALAALLGRTPSGASSMRVRLSELDHVISSAGLAATLREALELLDGPIANVRAERESREAAWRALLSCVQLPSDSTAIALLKRFSGGDAARAERLIAQIQRVRDRLPARGTPLAHLAAEALGDSHALDRGSPVATLLLRLCEEGPAPNANERVRDQWARLGVTMNELARPALFLNLTASGNSAGASLARAAAARGEPGYLSLRLLLREPPEWDVAGRDVFVCENPNVLTIAADRLGHHCAPLVCTEGMPAAAQQTLLAQISRRGGRLRYHGDFDWPGIAVANFLIRTFHAEPWRLGASDYLAACPERGKALGARGMTDARWDPRLRAAMAQRGMVVHEEAVAETLLADLPG